MLSKKKSAWIAPLAIGAAIGIGATINLSHRALAEEGEQGKSSASKYVFGGDTYPNKWYIKYAVDAGIHYERRLYCSRLSLCKNALCTG